MEPLRFNSIGNFWVQEISRLRFASLEMTGAAWSRCVPPQQETFTLKYPAGHEIHSCPAGYFRYFISYRLRKSAELLCSSGKCLL